jgi:glutathione S-transferase
MKLFHSPASPYVRKVLVCAHELGIVERIETLPITVTPSAPNRALAAHNPLMKIPTLLRAEGGEPLFDSVVICEYLDTLAGGALFPRDGERRWTALRLHALGDGILDAALLARYEAVLRPPALKWDDWQAGQFAKVVETLDSLEAAPALADGETFGIGQIAVACALGYLDFRFADRDWRAARPGLAGWYSTISQRPSMRATAPSA